MNRDTIEANARAAFGDFCCSEPDGSLVSEYSLDVLLFVRIWVSVYCVIGYMQ